MQELPDDRFVGMARLLNDDVSIDTARLLTGRIRVTPIIRVPEGSAEEEAERQREYFRYQTLRSMVEHFDTLSALVDEWIDSGINADCRERPWSRNVSEEKVEEYDECDGEAALLIVPRSRIRRMVHDYQEKHPPFLQLQRDGSTELYFAPEELTADEGPPMPEGTVVRLFIQFLDSPWRFHLMRCTRCRRFDFVNAPRKVYEYGWHCPGCSKNATAKRCVTNTRAKRREDLLQYCAEAWTKGERKYCQDRLAWVLQQVNKRLAYGAHIKRNFITRHLAEIQSRAERINNATRKG
jgi:hypothetical protein